MAAAKQINETQVSTAAPAISFKEKKRVTLPVVKFIPGIPIYVKIIGEMHLGKKVKGRGDKAQMEPATLAEVQILATVTPALVNEKTGVIEKEQSMQMHETPEEALMICATVLKSVLDENYPDKSYVGKGFKITKMEKKEGRSYNEYDLSELELSSK